MPLTQIRTCRNRWQKEVKPADWDTYETDATTGKEIGRCEAQIIDKEGNIVEEWTSTKEPHARSSWTARRNVYPFTKNCRLCRGLCICRRYRAGSKRRWQCDQGRDEGWLFQSEISKDGYYHRQRTGCQAAILNKEGDSGRVGNDGSLIWQRNFR